MNSRIIFAGAVGLALVGGVELGMWYTLRERPPVFCQISGRSIHANMRTVVQVDGGKLHACCPRCPLTLATQTGKRVRLVKVTDYPSGRALDASVAYFVDGSQVEVCSTPRVRVDEERLPYERLFDRCAPSLLAFAREDQARAFIAKYSGSLTRLDELMQQATSEQPPAGERRHD